MATMHLTKRVVEALEATPDCDYFVWDTSLKGLGVRVTARNDAAGKCRRRKVFLVGYRPQGGRTFRRITIGAFGPVTVEQARRSALAHLAAINTGSDPIDVRRAVKAQRTVRDLGIAYLSDVTVRRKKSTAAEYARLWEKHVLPAHGSKKVTAITAADIRRLHREMHGTPFLANRVVAMLGAFFTFAKREGVRADGDNPAHGVEFYPEHARERFLTPNEFRRLGAALITAESKGLPPAPQHRRKPGGPEKRKHVPKSAAHPIPANPLIVAAIRLLALTGCRENEVLSLRWDAIDLDHGYLRFADTKTGKSNRPLGASAALVLKSISPVAGNPFVFSSGNGDHLKEIKRVWYAVRHAAKLNDLRLHDLRHSFASVPASGGESLLILRSLLGHARAATTERYAHLAADPVRRAADRASGDISHWLAGHETAVAALQSRR